MSLSCADCGFISSVHKRRLLFSHFTSSLVPTCECRDYSSHSSSLCPQNVTITAIDMSDLPSLNTSCLMRFLAMKSCMSRTVGLQPESLQMGCSTPCHSHPCRSYKECFGSPSLWRICFSNNQPIAAPAA